MSHPISTQLAATTRPKPPSAVLADIEAQWIFTEEELGNTPSMNDGMSAEMERERRTKGVNFIMQVGMQLKLPQLTLTTAAVFFHRFLMRHSLVDKPGVKALHQYQVAATSVLVASKTEENIRKMKELVVACCRVAQKNSSLVVDESSKDFWKWRDSILYHEDIMLETLCFDVTIDSPHRILFGLLKTLGVETNKRLRNAAWAFINDSSLTMLCLLFTPSTIACCAIYCAAKHCELDPRFPVFDDAQGRAWYEKHEVKWNNVKKGVNYMADLYENNLKLQSSDATIYVGLRTPIAVGVEEEEEEHVDVKSGGVVEVENNLLNDHVSQNPASPGDWTGPDDTAYAAGVGSERGIKRERSGEPKAVAEAIEKDKDDDKVIQGKKEEVKAPEESEREPKKAKTQSNGDATDRKITPKVAARPTAPAVEPAAADEEGSEEGEVEE